MNPNPFNSASVIGYGAVGSALTDCLTNAGITVVSVWDRKTDVCRLKESDQLLPAGKNFPDSPDELGEMVFITTPDGQISTVAKRLSELTDNWTGYSFVHLSGSLSANVLTDLQKKGALIASLHPLQTFTEPNRPERFRNISFSLQGDKSLMVLLEQFVAGLDSESFRVNETQKEAMHIAAVFASNYMVALLDVVEGITKSHDIENGLEILEPIIRQTLQNVLTSGTSQSLSGPVARGDLDTLEKHLNFLKENQELSGLYKKLGLHCVSISKDAGKISDEEAERIRKLF